MERNPGIFLAFAGQTIDQAEPVADIGSGFEHWNLQQFDRDGFLSVLQQKIPPVNDSVLRQYKAEGNPERVGLSEETFSNCSWGLLIPVSVPDARGNSYAETLLLLNLYSPTFLYPVFHATDIGIRHFEQPHHLLTRALAERQSSVFRAGAFVAFFQTMLPQSQYGTWMATRAEKWNKEDWRLFVATMLFSRLRDYDQGKDPFTWLREAADMASILECLFTAGDTQNEEVGYRLRKRIGVLVAHRFAHIETEIKKLYTDRSAFVHGAFFSRIAKESRDARLPTPDFTLLYRQKEYVRHALVAYLYVAGVIRSQPQTYGGLPSAIEVLEQALLDIELRHRVIADAEMVLALLPSADARFA